MGRKIGSGLASTQANACASLLVSIACDREDDRDAAMAELDREHEADRCGLSGEEIHDLMVDLLSRWPLAGAGFTGGRPLVGGLGDAYLTSAQAGNVFVEIKAQTKKEGFDAITQADWVRNDTDFVRHHAQHHPFFAGHRKAGHPGVTALTTGWSPPALSPGELWAADVGLLHNAAKREHAGAKCARSLRRFLERKWLLHLTLGGGRLICLAQIPAVERALASGEVAHRIAENPQSESSGRRGLAKIPVVDADGRAVFTYHLYTDRRSGELVGRHKAHARLFDAAPSITTRS